MLSLDNTISEIINEKWIRSFYKHLRWILEISYKRIYGLIKEVLPVISFDNNMGKTSFYMFNES